MISLSTQVINPTGDGRICFLFDPSDVGNVYRREGAFPFRGDTFDCVKRWRESRPDLYPDTKGLLVEEGTRW